MNTAESHQQQMNNRTARSRPAAPCRYLPAGRQVKIIVRARSGGLPFPKGITDPATAFYLYHAGELMNTAENIKPTVNNSRRAGAPSQRLNKYQKNISHFLRLRHASAHEQDDKVNTIHFIYTCPTLNQGHPTATAGKDMHLRCLRAQEAQTAKGHEQAQDILQMALAGGNHTVLLIMLRSKGSEKRASTSATRLLVTMETNRFTIDFEKRNGDYNLVKQQSPMKCSIGLCFFRLYILIRALSIERCMFIYILDEFSF